MINFKLIEMKKVYNWICIFLTVFLCFLAFKILLLNIGEEIVEASSVEQQTNIVQANEGKNEISQVLPRFFIHKTLSAMEVNHKRERGENGNLSIFGYAFQKLIRVDYRDPKILFKAEIPLLKEMDDDMAEIEDYFIAQETLNGVTRQKERIPRENPADMKGKNAVPPEKDAAAANSANPQKDQVDIVSSPVNMPQKLTLDESKPTIFIYHTHATESYLPETTGNFHSLKREYTVRAVGDELAAQLEKRGYKVIHDDTVHDYPSYQQSYVRSLKTLEENLKENPSLKIIFDIHRDAAPKVDGVSKHSYVTINNEKVARFSIVVGTGNPNAKELQTFAEYINAKSDEKYPGLMKGIIFKPYKFNQYRSNYYALLEMGDTANHIDEAVRTAKYLAEILESVFEDIKK